MKSLFAKMLAVQKALKPIPKDETNPHFNSKYYDIDGVVAQLRPALNKAGLVVMQPILDGKIVTTVCDPESGEEKFWMFDLPATQDIQKLGAAISYMRRYALVSLFLLEGEDTDGNGVSAPASAPAGKPSQAGFNAPPSLGTCKDCGAGNAWSAGKQKAYCSKMCWKTPVAPKSDLPTISYDEPPMPSQPNGDIPF